MIGDSDPEDAYDATDPPHIRLAVIARVFQELYGSNDTRRQFRYLDALRLLRNTLADLEHGR